ncbi:MAG TPA: GTPase ObgE [Tissierellia bacterium]|nr:GTPase ObgE [Tissierellia bacterium]
MFIDRAEIHVKAGKGGDGSAAFRREIHEPMGGPSGGDGGRGGSIVATVDQGMNTLMDFRYKRKYVAANGENGGKSNRYGKSGADLILRFPQGTVIFEKTTGKLIADLSDPEDRVVLAAGGRGGKGNVHFKSSVRQAPDFAQPGAPGEELSLVLELKSIADVGLVGFPNAGKSSLLARLTKATPKIADYPFTTLTPNLGVFEVVFGKSYVMADIPGLIEGAAEGVGLGHDFLRHVERTRLILHLVDVGTEHEEKTPLERYEIIRRELEGFSQMLADKPEVVLLNKVDLLYEREGLEELENVLTEKNIPYFLTSTYTGEGLDEAMKAVTTLLEQVESPDLFEDVELYIPETPDQEIYITFEDGEYVVEGAPIERLFHYTNFLSYHSRIRFQRSLRRMGIYERLREMGIQDGDTVRVHGYAFEYVE